MGRWSKNCCLHKNGCVRPLKPRARECSDLISKYITYALQTREEGLPNRVRNLLKNPGYLGNRYHSESESVLSEDDCFGQSKAGTELSSQKEQKLK